jgi:hypothetical protein
MRILPNITIVHRDELSAALMPLSGYHQFRSIDAWELRSTNIPSKGAIVGYWDKPGSDPFPDFMLVNDRDYNDTLAWLSAYMNALAPVTQWCRIWPQSRFSKTLDLNDLQAGAKRLGCWVGSILAECSFQSQSSVNLNELSGTAAMTSASFAAARALFVLADNADLMEIAERHDDLSARLRVTGRPLNAKNLMPLWYALSGRDWLGKPPANFRTLDPFVELFSLADNGVPIAAEFIEDVAQKMAFQFNLQAVADCVKGPQNLRVVALDEVAEQLLNGPRSPAVEALLGFSASLVDIGAPVLPELLRRYSSKFPAAAVWQGAFAGLWSPIRVLSDFKGLGRYIAKNIKESSDLFSKPRCDIAFEELDRWIGNSMPQQIPVRGAAARTLNVELVPGVTCPIPLSRAPVRPEVRSKQESLNFNEASKKRIPVETGSSDSLNLQLAKSLDALSARIDELENLAKIAGNTKSSAAASKRSRAPK